MKDLTRVSNIRVGIKGGGDMASGVVWRFHRCGFKVFIAGIPRRCHPGQKKSRPTIKDAPLVIALAIAGGVLEEPPNFLIES